MQQQSLTSGLGDAVFVENAYAFFKIASKHFKKVGPQTWFKK